MKVTNIKFINKLTGEIVLAIKEGEEVEDWVLPYAKIDRGLWSVYSYSCEEADDVLNGGRVNVLLNRVPAQGNLFAFFG